MKRGQCAVRGASHAQMPRHNAANRAENESTASQARPPDIRYILTACWDVSYSAFDVQKDDSHTGQGRVAAQEGRRRRRTGRASATVQRFTRRRGV